MYQLKGCPRCHGDLHLVHDLGDDYLACIQCGHLAELLVEAATNIDAGATAKLANASSKGRSQPPDALVAA